MRFTLTSRQSSSFQNVVKNTDLLLDILCIQKNKNTTYLLEAAQKLYPTNPDFKILLELLSIDWSDKFHHQLHVECDDPFASNQTCHFLNAMFYKKKICLPETSQHIQIPKDEFYNLIVFHREPRSTLLLYSLRPGATLVFPVTDFYQASTLRLIWESVHRFEEVVMCKPVCKPILEDTKYIVATGYKNSKKEEEEEKTRRREEENHYPLSWQYSIIDMYNQFTNYQENFLTKTLELSKILQLR